MFQRLFKYISGVNQEGQEVEMTAPVMTLHKVTTDHSLFGGTSSCPQVVKEDRLGDLEMQLMCFYLPSKYQNNHHHKVPHSSYTSIVLASVQETKPAGPPTKPAPRHAAVFPPMPMEGSHVVLYNRPEMSAYARRFGGWALTAETWEQHRQQLREDLIGKRVRENEYFTVSYDSPMQMVNRWGIPQSWSYVVFRRNEVVIQAEAGENPADFVLLEQLVDQELVDQEGNHH